MFAKYAVLLPFWWYKCIQLRISCYFKFLDTIISLKGKLINCSFLFTLFSAFWDIYMLIHVDLAKNHHNWIFGVLEIVSLSILNYNRLQCFLKISEIFYICFFLLINLYEIKMEKCTIILMTIITPNVSKMDITK